MQTTRETRISGRIVLISLVAFFAVITAVNAIMATLAIRTFGGVEADNAYRAGLEFSREISAARAQQERNIQVDVVTSRTASGVTRFTLTMRGHDVSIEPQLAARLELRHPANKRRDHIIILERRQAGVFEADALVEAGQWNVRVSVDRAGERIFRSVNRVAIP